MPIIYLKGDATVPQASGPKVITHIVNDKGGWGKGFVLHLSKRWKDPEAYYRRWAASKEDFRLGEIQVVQVKPDIWVANMVAQFGYKVGSKGPPIRYDALRACLRKLAPEVKYLKASIHAPRLGCGLAGGRWELVEPLIEQELAGLDVYVYDYSG